MPDELASAVEHHRAGRLREAAAAYEQILAAKPDDPEASHLLGVLRHQQGAYQRAVELISRAVAMQPNVARYHANLAEAFRALGQFDRAVGCCRTALRLTPNYPEAICNLGLAIQGLGQLDEAAAEFRRAIELRPDFAAAHNNLGNVLRELEQLHEATEEFELAVKADPNYPPARTNLGQILLDRGRAEDALPHAQEAVRLQPNVAAFHHNLGNVYRRLKRNADARSAYLESLRIDPNLARAQLHLGLVLQEEGRFDEALHWLKLAAESEPENIVHWERLGSLYEEREEYGRAIPCWRRVLEKQPDRAEIHVALGWALQEESQLIEAEEHYREALRLRPDAAGAMLNLGGLLEELGDLAGAEAAFRQALQLQPAYALPYARLSTLLRDKLPDADLAALEERLRDANLDPRPKGRLHFALAAVRDARNEFPAAAASANDANALALQIGRGRREYDPTDHERFVDGLIREFNGDFFDRIREAGSGSRRPVFVIGLPRSGTTLIEQILASHPRVHGAGELRLARRTFESLPGRGDSPMECVANLDRAAIRNLAERYLGWLSDLDPDSDRIVDKMPDNYLYVGLLAAMFPNATFIHCRRDLRDIAVSCWITDFRSIRWANDPLHIASRFRQYRRVMNHWRVVQPVSIHTFDYEDVVADLEGAARRLLSNCRLDWDPACLRFFANKRPVRTASVAQVRQPLYNRSVGRWRNYESLLRPLFDALQDVPAESEPEVR